MRSPEKCGYSVGKLCPTAKLCMIAVFGPKSLYSGLAIRRMPSLELKEANIIQDTRTTYPAISNQSAMLDPVGRGRYLPGTKVLGLSSSARFMTLCFHLFHDSRAIAAMPNKRLAHKSGFAVHANASPAK